ncbi:MAG: hypothetical protein Q7S32_04265 [bacterium]|nr:hypothetical protein [bacterium]
MDNINVCGKEGCGKPTDGYKCVDCKQESGSQDVQHACGDGKCMPKCSGCSEGEAQCSCSSEVVQ